MELDESTIPLFLGVSRRAARRAYEWDLIGLSNIVGFPFFPQKIHGLQCVLGLNRKSLASPDGLSYRLVLTDQARPANQAWSDQALSSVAPGAAAGTAVRDTTFSVPALPPDGGTGVFGLQLVGTPEDPGSIELFATPAPPLLIYEPCRVLVDIEMEGKRYPRGEFICAFVPPPPLSDEERRALASRPEATKHVRFELGCKKCGVKTVFYLPLDPLAPRPSKLEPDAILVSDAPPTWNCKCGSNHTDLSFLKLGLHDLLRRSASAPLPSGSQVGFTPLYEAGRIQDIVAEYEQLIETTTEEEPVQKYLEEHPLFWAFLSPAKILHKPPVLTKKRADFGILTVQKVLYLVEIERPTTRLTNQDGAISAEIQKGANQIRDWQVVVADHRLALMSELGLREGDVQEIRYLLIGGLARRTTPTGLTKLRRTPFAANTDFYCFDELGSFLHSVARELNRL